MSDDRYLPVGEFDSTDAEDDALAGDAPKPSEPERTAQLRHLSVFERYRGRGVKKPKTAATDTPRTSISARASKMTTGTSMPKIQANKKALVMAIVLGILGVVGLLALGGWKLGIVLFLVVAGVLLMLSGKSNSWLDKPFNSGLEKPGCLEHEHIGPKTGLRSLFWNMGGSWLYSRYKWESLATPSWKERDRIAMARLRSMDKVQKIVAVANSKGGSAKTPICAYTAVTWMDTLRNPITVIDVNEGPGTIATWLGIDIKDNPTATIKLFDYVDKFEQGEASTLEDLTKFTGTHKDSGVKVISSHPEVHRPIALYKLQAALQNLKTSCVGLMCDFGNSPMGVHNRGSLLLADTLIFTCDVKTVESDEILKDNLKMYTEGEVQMRPMPNKVKNSVIVVVGDKLDTRQLIRHGTTQTKLRQKYADMFEHPLEQVFIIPYNQYMAEGNIVDLRRIPFRILVILKEILVAVLASEVDPEERYILRNPQEVAELDSEPVVTTSPAVSA